MLCSLSLFPNNGPMQSNLINHNWRQFKLQQYFEFAINLFATTCCNNMFVLNNKILNRLLHNLLNNDSRKTSSAAFDPHFKMVQCRPLFHLFSIKQFYSKYMRKYGHPVSGARIRTHDSWWWVSSLTTRLGLPPIWPTFWSQLLLKNQQTSRWPVLDGNNANGFKSTFSP